jgi:DnaJ-class molecular chaperone
MRETVPQDACPHCGVDGCECGDERSCHFCDGDGVVDGERMGNPLWYSADHVYMCPCCHGSGAAKDCTFW